jgi:hypothetical protein
MALQSMASTEYGIVDSTGVITYTAPAKRNISFDKNRFVVKIKDKDPKKENMALVDEKGKLLIPFDTHKINLPGALKEDFSYLRTEKKAFSTTKEKRYSLC